MKQFVICLGLLVAPGCRSLDATAAPVVLPPAAIITAVEVTPHFGETRPTTVITQPERIERLVQFVNARGDGWREPWDTFPSGAYTVRLLRDDQLVAVFWPTSAWIGGREGDRGHDSNRLRPLSDEDWRELQSILGIAATPDHGAP